MAEFVGWGIFIQFDPQAGTGGQFSKAVAHAAGLLEVAFAQGGLLLV